MQFLTGKVDIYAVGILYNYLLTGCLPGVKLTEDKSARKVILKATQIDRVNRYDNVEQMWLELQPESTDGLLPGFRSGATWHKFVAGTFYLMCMAGVFFYVIDACKADAKTVNELVGAILVFAVAPLVIGNIFFWDMEVPGIRSLSKTGRLMIRILIGAGIIAWGISLLPGLPF